MRHGVRSRPPRHLLDDGNYAKGRKVLTEPCMVALRKEEIASARRSCLLPSNTGNPPVSMPLHAQGKEASIRCTSRLFKGFKPRHQATEQEVHERKFLTSSEAMAGRL